MTTRHRPRPRRWGRIRGRLALLLLTFAGSIGRVDCCWGNGPAGRTSTALSRKPAAATGFLPLRPATPPPSQRLRARSTSTRMRATDTHSTGQRVRRTALLTLPGAGLYLATSAASGFALEGSVERALAGAAAACTGLAVAAYGGQIRRALVSGGDGGGKEKGEETVAEGFVGFQRSYLALQALATFVDFIQGPFLYKVYADTFGLGTNDIALLYLVGFGASALAAPVAGPFADAYGRRLGCMAFAGLQAASSLLLHLGPALLPLALGRLLSGVASAFLATCFESWMVAEHTQRRFPPTLLPSTFSLQVFLLGATAVGAGAAAGAAVDASGGSYLAPFDVCAAVSAATVFVIPALWRTENYGVREEEDKGGLGRLWAAAREGAGVFMAGRKEVLWLGLTQVCFEAALFTWVFLWTPALESAQPPIPNLNLGLVFAALMVGVSAGGTAFRLLVSSNNGDTEGHSEKEERNDAVSSPLSSAQVLSGALALAASSLGLASLPLTIRGDSLLATFVLFEVAVGAYSAAIADLRARLLPDPRRATLMNQTHLAQNALVVAMYLGPLRMEADMGTVKRRVALGLCAGLVLLAAAALSRLRVAMSLAGEQGEERLEE